MDLHKSFDALDSYEKALEIDPLDTNSWFLKGTVFQNIERYEKAIECYEKLLEIDPYTTDARSFKGFNLEQLDNYDEAIECYETALNIDPNHPYAEIRMRIVLKKLDYKERP
jgi:tetratricopeptide (TPR) repeat protein